MSLHVEVHGAGAPLVLLHGWGMNGAVWGEAVQRLARHFRVYCVDLPGHGASAPAVPFNLEALVQQLSTEFAGPLDVAGWSLGGQLALRWAQRIPGQVRRLVLVATTPCFVQAQDWTCAMAADTLRDFHAALIDNHALTLRRFIALQLRGSEDERELHQMLREHVFSRGHPDLDTLQDGLAILRDTDLRRELAGIRQPALVIAGERDKLTPPQASHYLARALHDGRSVEIGGAAHAPFLSHPDIFVDHVVNFLNG